MWNRTENQITFLLIRHGATAANREHRYIGRTDEPLSADGQAQIVTACEQQKYPQAEHVFVSPMLRCKMTAELIYPGVPKTYIADWCEMDFGRFEGKNYEELKGDAAYRTWIDSNGMLPFPDGESREAFIRRVETGFWQMTAQLADRAEKNTVAAVVHGGTIMALLSRFGGGAYFDYQIPNGEGYRCTLYLGKQTAGIEDIERL